MGDAAESANSPTCITRTMPPSCPASAASTARAASAAELDDDRTSPRTLSCASPGTPTTAASAVGGGTSQVGAATLLGAGTRRPAVGGGDAPHFVATSAGHAGAGRDAGVSEALALLVAADHPVALAALAARYGTGRGGVARNPPRAVMLFERVLAHPATPPALRAAAANSLGTILAFGDAGVPRDARRGAALLRAAASADADKAAGGGDSGGDARVAASAAKTLRALSREV